MFMMHPFRARLSVCYTSNNIIKFHIKAYKVFMMGMRNALEEKCYLNVYFCRSCSYFDWVLSVTNKVNI